MVSPIDRIISTPTLQDIAKPLFEHGSIGCSLLSSEGQIVSVTSAFAKMLGWEPERLIRQSLFDVLTFGDDANVSGLLADGTSERVSAQADGRVLWWSVHKIASDSGEGDYLIGLLRDESGHESFERRLLHRDRLAVLGGLTASVAHEIAGPLNVIANNAELLLDENEMDGDARQSLTLMRDEAHRLGTLLNDVLCFARDTPLKVVAQDAVKLVQKTLQLFNQHSTKKNILFRVQAEPNLPPVAGDSERLQQAFFNLIKNASDASAEGSEVLIHVRVAPAEQQDSVIEIAVIDQGEGIPADELKQIFRPFYSTKAVGLGTGLGLPIAQNIVAAHNGQLTLKSVPGQGTHASILLPVFSHAGELAAG